MASESDNPTALDTLLRDALRGTAKISINRFPSTNDLRNFYLQPQPFPLDDYGVNIKLRLPKRIRKPRTLGGDRRPLHEEAAVVALLLLEVQPATLCMGKVVSRGKPLRLTVKSIRHGQG